ncbi:auxin-responsive protein IAA13-like [Lycium ferocissimum]|uniref:auxin-responsive protein IAA13-like n=1 Tax=Lycium ferocissimum TaxID=112874 RepID=UPI00281499F1|nr:auxin-responsive protein IAA13-like [Lycium ferocissimum]
METTLGLLGGDDTSSSVSKMDHDYSSYTDETGLELGLGLGPSLTKAKKSSRTWCEYGSILTAKDFPNGFITGTVNNMCVDSSTENTGNASTSSSQVVGWPPIRTYRMNSFNQSKITNADQEENGASGNKEMESSKKKINHGNTKNEADFVKVNMDGLPIGRKVDLGSHTCYETLGKTLEEMFFKSTKTTNSTNCGENEQVKKSCKLLDGSSGFVLTYEDKDGDWMLVGDVPWGMFLSTVKRLRIMRTTEAKGLGM